MTIFLIRYLRYALLCFFAAFCISGCASNGGDLASAGNFSTSISTVAHYGKGIVIAKAYLNGRSIGYQKGWGGGGGGDCCVSMSTNGSQPTLVTVKWETYRADVNESRWHEETVSVHFAVPPGKGSGLKVHFLPGHHVQVWYTDMGPSSTIYPGPAYMRDPAPEYVPLPGEKSIPVGK